MKYTLKNLEGNFKMEGGLKDYKSLPFVKFPQPAKESSSVDFVHDSEDTLGEGSFDLSGDWKIGELSIETEESESLESLKLLGNIVGQILQDRREERHDSREEKRERRAHELEMAKLKK